MRYLIFNLDGFLFIRIVRLSLLAGEPILPDVARVAPRDLAETSPFHRARDPPRKFAARAPLLRGLFFCLKSRFALLYASK